MITSIAAAIMMAETTLIGVQPAFAAGSVSLVAAADNCHDPTSWGNYNVARNPFQQRPCAL
ncbi:hypothetical protein J5X84_41545 [Streptosporangiaceae bacterium NEAU-GS5]|nr:hypothetical protein [Streptosporangiaceae bacterium NEAU-GS5]